MAAPTIVTGILTGGSNNHATSSEEANAVATDFISEGVVGTITNTAGVAPMTGAFGVNASGSPDTNINISTGVAYVTATPTSQNSQALRVKCSVTGTLAISANSSGSTKYDWIYIKVDATAAANPNSGADDVATIVASRSSSASTDDGTPPTYGYPIAVVTVANGFSTITNGNIRDIRTNAIVNLASSSTSGWTALGLTPNTVTANGNRSYDLVFNNTNLTTTLSAGQRLKINRLVTAPTQCTDLEAGSSQYYSKSSPAGMTFTDDFVVSAWVKLESYAVMDIAGRYNGTSGWQFQINSSGQVMLIGRNANVANYSYVQSYQSLPLGKWVHVAAQLDMSTFTATTTTSYVMFDGVDVPANVARGGTNPTALVQAGDLQIGAANTTEYFDGKIAQVAIYNAKVTQATIKASMNQGLSGSETSLISAYSFNNSINDLSANANNLTANGSAVATNADSPFSLQADGTTSGTTDYAIITKTAFSTNTTLTVQVPEGNAIPTSGGVSAVSYSSVKAPYGMPIQQSKWDVETLSRSTQTTTSASYASTNITIQPPVGDWRLSAAFYINSNDSTSSSDSGADAALSTSTSAVSDTRMFAEIYFNGATASNMNVAGIIYLETSVNIATVVPYYLITKCLGSNSTNISGPSKETRLLAEFKYL